MTIRQRILAPAIALILSGCGGGGPKTHPVAGRVEVTGGNPAPLAGSTVEVALDRDPTVRAFGEIQPDGRFELQSLQAGEVRGGVPEGTYAVRIIPNDEDGATRARATQAVARRYLKFETSGLSVQVPAKDDVTLRVAAK